MIGSGLLRSSWMPPALVLPAGGPPWEITSTTSPHLIIFMLWVAGILAIYGVVAGMIAARRGMPVPLRSLLAVAALGILALILLPPVGSTDPLDYAVYGHIVGLGRDPYVMTPFQFRQLTHIGGIPVDWQRVPSVYGPLATGEQYIAAKLGGNSLARAVLWLKLANGIAFGAVALIADRALLGNRAARLRAHLLWTANPLIIWSAIAGGHLDVLAAALGLAGLVILDRERAGRPMLRAAAAGACIGTAADIKATFLLFGLAIAWALRRQPRQLAAAALGAVVVLVPSYGIAGTAAIEAVTTRASTGIGWGFYRIFRHFGLPFHDAVPVACVLLIPVAWLALTRLPEGFGNRPAIRAALAVSLAWLLVWPHQYAWYSLMAICLLVLYPASRLDWLAVIWLSAMTMADIPGLGASRQRELSWLDGQIQGWNITRIVPVVMLATLIALVVLCLNRRWNPAPAAPGPQVPA
jgi:hypothetical protein